MARLTEQEQQEILRSLELQSVAHECALGRRKVAVKVVDIFGNDTMTIIEVNVEGKR